MADRLGLDTSVSDMPYSQEDSSLFSDDLNLNVDSLIGGSAPIPQVQSQPQGPAVKYQPRSGKMFVNGFEFSADDHERALQSKTFLTNNRVEPDTGGWVDLSPQEYGNYVNKIQDPSTLDLFLKNLDRGLDVGQLLFGRALQFVGAEETGKAMVDRNIEQLRKTSPYERSASEIKDIEGAWDWFWANLGQGVPLVLESIGVGVAAALAPVTTTTGAAISAPLMFVGRQMAKNIGTKKWRSEVTTLFNKRSFGDISPSMNINRFKAPIGKGKKPYRKPFTLAEANLAKRVLAMGAIAANSYAIGVADIYGELREGGSEASDMNARLATLAGAFPYALLESLPEIFIGARFLKGTGKGGLGYRAGKVGEGIAYGGILEGITETGQEEILMRIDEGVNDTENLSDETLKRRWNSFWAGFGIGGPIGGLASLRKGEPTDLLKIVPTDREHEQDTKDAQDLDQAEEDARQAEQTSEERNILEEEDLTDQTDFDQAAINQEELKDETETDAVNVEGKTITDGAEDVPPITGTGDATPVDTDVVDATPVDTDVVDTDDSVEAARQTSAEAMDEIKRLEDKAFEEQLNFSDLPDEEATLFKHAQTVREAEAAVIKARIKHQEAQLAIVQAEENAGVETSSSRRGIEFDIEKLKKEFDAIQMDIDEIYRKEILLEGEIHPDRLTPDVVEDSTDTDPIIRGERPEDSLSDYETVANFVSQNINKRTSPDWPGIAGLHILNIGAESNIQGRDRLKKGSNIPKGDNIYLGQRGGATRIQNRDPETGRVSTITLTNIEDPNTKKLVEVAEVIVNPNPVVFDLTLSEEEQKERYSGSLFWRKIQEDKQRDLKTEGKKQEAPILKLKKETSPKKVSPLDYGIPAPPPIKDIPETLTNNELSKIIRILGADGKVIVYEGLNKAWAKAVNKKLKGLGVGLDGLTLELQDEILNDLISKGQFKKKKLEKLKKPDVGIEVVPDKAKPITGSELVSMPPELMLNSEFFSLFVESKAAEQFKFDSFKKEFFDAGSKVKEQEKVYVKYFLDGDYGNNKTVFDKFRSIIQEQVNIYRTPRARKKITLERLFDWRAAFAKHAIESGRELTPSEFTYHMDSIVQPIVGSGSILKQAHAKTKGEFKFKNIGGESLIDWSAGNLFNGDTALNNVQKSILYNQFIANFMELNNSIMDGNVPPSLVNDKRPKWFAFLEQVDAAAAGEDTHQKLGTKLYKAIIASGVINDAKGKPSEAKFKLLIKNLSGRQISDWGIRLEISDEYADSNDEDEAKAVKQIQDKITKLLNWNSAKYGEFNTIRKQAEKTMRRVVKAMNGEKGVHMTERTAEQIWHSWLSMPRQYSQFYNMLDPESDMTEIQVSQLWDTKNDRLYSLDRWVYPSEYTYELSVYKFASTPTPKVVVPKTIYDLAKENPKLGKKVTEIYRNSIRGVNKLIDKSEHTQVPLDAYTELIDLARNKTNNEGIEYNDVTKDALHIHYLMGKHPIATDNRNGLADLLDALTSDYILGPDGKPMENPDGSGKIEFKYGRIIRGILKTPKGGIQKNTFTQSLYARYLKGTTLQGKTIAKNKKRPKLITKNNFQELRKAVQILIGYADIIDNNPAVNIKDVPELTKYIKRIVREVDLENLNAGVGSTNLQVFINEQGDAFSTALDRLANTKEFKRIDSEEIYNKPEEYSNKLIKQIKSIKLEREKREDRIAKGKERTIKNPNIPDSQVNILKAIHKRYAGLRADGMKHKEAVETISSELRLSNPKLGITEKHRTAMFSGAQQYYVLVGNLYKTKPLTPLKKKPLRESDELEPTGLTDVGYGKLNITEEINAEKAAEDIDNEAVEIPTDAEGVALLLESTEDEPRKRLRKKGEKPDNPLNILQIQSTISNVLKKLRVKPKVKVFKTIEDLINDPNVDDIVKISLITPGFDINTWYNAEVLTDIEKGFPSFVKYARELQKMGIKQPSSLRVKDRVEGISYGDKVYIIADQIKSKDHLKTVLAHEAIGHFGLRSIIEPKKLNSILEDIYKNTEESDPYFHNLVKRRRILNDTLSLSEAVEETLADQIEVIETSLIKKLIHLILSAFDKLGIPLADGMETRYLINQARRYVRGGDTRIGIYSSQAIRDNVAKLQKEADIRFSRNDNLTGQIENIVHSNSPGNSRSPKQLIELAKKAGINIKDKGLWRSLKQFSQTTNNHARASFGLSKVYEAMSDIGAMRNSLLNSYAGLRPLMNKLREWGVLNKVGTDRDIINQRHSSELTVASLRLQLDKLDSFYSEEDINKALASGKIIEFFRDYNKYAVRDGYTKSDQDLRIDEVDSYAAPDKEGKDTLYKSGWWVMSQVLDNKQLVNRETKRINKDVWKLYEDFLPTFEEVINYMRTDPIYKSRDTGSKPSGIKTILAERKEKGLGDLGDIPWKLYLEGRLTVSESKKDVYLNTVSGYYQLIAAQTNEFFDMLSQSYIDKGNLKQKDYIELEDGLKNLQKSVRDLSYINFDLDKYQKVLRDTKVRGVKGSKVDEAIRIIKQYDNDKHYLINFVETVFYKYTRSINPSGKSREALAYMPIALKIHTELGLNTEQLKDISGLIKSPQIYELFTKGIQTFDITPNQGKQLNDIYKEIAEIADGLDDIDHRKDFKQDTNFSHINPGATEIFNTIISKDVLEIAEAYEIINAVRTLADATDKGKNIFTRTKENPVTSEDISRLQLPEGLVEQIDKLIQSSGSLIGNADKIRPSLDNQFNPTSEKIDYGTLKQFQDTLISLLYETAALQNEVKQLEQTILTTYFPLRRRGDWFMDSQIGHYNKKNIWIPYDSKNGVSLKSLNNIQWKQNLPYMQGTKSEMLAKQKELSEFLEDQKITIDGQEFLIRTFVGEVEKETIEPFFSTDLRQTLMMFRRLGIALNKKQKIALVKQLSSESSSLRKGLRREFIPGWDENIMRNQVEYSTANAHIAAKMKHYHRITRAIDNEKYWKGDGTKLRNLEEEYKGYGDYAHNESEEITEGRIVAKQAYDDYRYKYKHSADIGPDNFIIDDNGKKQPTLGRGAEYKDIAVKLWDHFRSDQGSENLIDDWLNSNPVGRKLKALAVTSQLGGTAAAGIINFGTMITHAPAVLATYNPERGFGGGFGFAKASAELIRALKDVGGIRFGRLDDLEIIVAKWKDKSKSEHGLTYDEANFLLRETKSGMLSAAEPRAWLGMARQGPGGQIGFKIQEAWMSWFGYTEKLNRRSTALAAYRLFKRRGESAGKTGKDLNNYIRRHTDEIVGQAQGDYTLPNRPEWGRTPFGQYLYIYKTFQIITVQLLWNLPYKGKLTMLGMLFLFAGLKGLPFGEDMIDLVDSAGALLGVTRGNIELAAKQILEETVPGSSKVVMRGALDSMGWTWSSRLSMGNLIPATGMFRVGRGPAEYSRDTLDFAGPVVSNTKGLILSINMLYNYFTSKLTGTPSPDIMDIIKKNPIAGLRNFADGIMYYKDGTITNARGKVMVPDVTVNEMIGRFVGFYPARAHLQNTAIKLSKYHLSYNRDIKTTFVNEYVQARLAGDTGKMQSVVDAMYEWNANVPEEYKITKFFSSANTSFKANQKAAWDRFRATVGNKNEFVKMIGEIHSMEDILG